jgi:DNA-binding NtrC family response regulator
MSTDTNTGTSAGVGKILLVDDDPNVLSALQRELRQHFGADALQVEAFGNPFDALNRICVCEFDLVISDFTMPEMSGGDLLRTLKEVAPSTVRIMLTASTAFDTALTAINQAEVFRFMPKPWESEALAQTVRLALAHRAALLAAPTPQELEAQRLEAEEPGILDVRRDADGAIIL